METIRLFNTLTWPLVYGARCSCVLGHRQRLSDCSERFTLNSLDIIRFLIVHEGRMLAKQVGAELQRDAQGTVPWGEGGLKVRLSMA